MQDPVIDHEGNSYEKESILEWLRNHAVSPITRSPLRATQLQPNRALKEFIESQQQPPTSSRRSATPIPPEDATPEAANSVRFEPLSTIENATFLLNPNNGFETHFAIKIKDELSSMRRLPVDVVCVIDVSGSMQSAATFKNENSQTEDTGLSILDVVKHGLRTTVASLQTQDRLALVTFSSNANVVGPLTAMTTEGKNNMNHHIDNMTIRDSTNIWAGLEKAFGCHSNNAGETGVTRSRTIFLFTDGQPNISPPRGELQTMKNYLDTEANRMFPFVLHTFGFGYEMNSELLCQIAEETGGTYSFIPDAGFVGTVMIHRLANLLSTVVNKAHVIVEGSNSGEIVRYNIGGLLLGQQRTFTVPHNTSHATLYLDGERMDLSSGPVEWFNDEVQKEERIRNEVTHLLKIVRPSSRLQIKSRLNLILQVWSQREEECPQWKHDLEDQVLPALSAEHYERWGFHYIRSFNRAHELQQANNFKDQSIQKYGGKRFAEERDRLDQVFLTLPEARPSRPMRTVQTRGGGIQTLSAPRTVAMQSYHSCSNDCIAENALVETQPTDEGVRCFSKIQELRKGDVLYNNDIVECVVLSQASHPPLVHFNCKNPVEESFFITPYHPIKLTADGEWVFPIKAPLPHSLADSPDNEEKLYSILTQEREPIRIGGPKNYVYCATLGHGEVSSPVIGHPYFGSKKVVEEIVAAKGYKEGLVKIKRVIRADGLISGSEFY